MTADVNHEQGRSTSAPAAVGRFILRIPRYLLLVPVFAYRWLISPMLPNACIYTPTCSHYTVEAILEHGALKGLALGVARVVRCTGGFFEGGHDPVPAEFSFEAIREGFRRHRRGRQGRRGRRRRKARGEEDRPA
jgi:putative membrane protein insertion efficiency factor